MRNGGGSGVGNTEALSGTVCTLVPTVSRVGWWETSRHIFTVIIYLDVPGKLQEPLAAYIVHVLYRKVR